MKNKLTVTRGEGEGDNRGQKGKGCQGTWIKDPWTNQSGEGLRVGGGVSGGKWKQLYLNNNKKIKISKK